MSEPIGTQECPICGVAEPHCFNVEGHRRLVAEKGPAISLVHAIMSANTMAGQVDIAYAAIERMVQASATLTTQLAEARRERDALAERCMHLDSEREHDKAEYDGKCRQLADSAKALKEAHAEVRRLELFAERQTMAVDEIAVSNEHLHESNERLAAMNANFRADVIDSAKAAEALRAALERVRSAIWDKHYGKGLSAEYARDVEREIESALATAKPEPAQKES